MDDLFTIHIEQLKEGRRAKIEFEVGPEFLDVQEEDTFKAPVILKGEAYLADGALILRLDIITEASVPCAICNGEVEVPIHLLGLYYSEETSAIRGGIFHYKNLVREEILLDLPLKAECGGSCPERNEVVKYFAKGDPEMVDRYHPFKDI